MSARRFFTVSPGEVFEHPPTFPVDIQQIPTGPVDGWECYAVDFNGDGVVGPFTAVVRTDGERGKSITPPGTMYPFVYLNDSPVNRRPCWYQSGCTLRFIKAKEVKESTYA